MDNDSQKPDKSPRSNPYGRMRWAATWIPAFAGMTT